MSQYAKIGRVDPSPWAGLSDHPAEHIDRLAEDIAERGIQTPLHVYPRGERYELLAGHDRLEAAKRAGKSDVPIEVRTTLNSEDERFSYFCRDNTLRKTVEPRAVAREGLKRWPQLSNREVARRVGVGEATVRRVRDELEEAGQVRLGRTSTGADGKQYPTHKPAHKPRQVIPIDRPRPEARPIREPVRGDALTKAIAERLPEPERGSAQALVRGPGIPEHRAIEMLDNLAGMEQDERTEIYQLNSSDDARDRSLAISKAANKPPMPEPAAGMLLRLGRLMGECVNALDRHPDYANRIREMRTEITTMQEHLYGARTA